MLSLGQLGFVQKVQRRDLCTILRRILQRDRRGLGLMRVSYNIAFNSESIYRPDGLNQRCSVDVN
ncbi:hypothetical protein CPB83DRAFT_865608 [Crepidotus variabilis]|uniref:Uncharacterized protein n=1 Tax=Crepidotus variabilis TaxID=179855 RepID=A0A9P6BC15_9AGAR|nr:hypothetical protein CPB83DRAFT_865608 [Crepidotus variabilis]